ncbi:GntR family transcriptional regulator [Bosea sp. (in: a-proteobacteria)]|jgi:DNA-binding GntR family transcriptional regulator|uniref:GntR family transcriptional regulator n=1 Tax=Bosea sp. (in: a-proteobacteria) TaxID=1871050 RepID=UPI002DDD56BD|nr:GntR family transcriptional regulator [Bosea sp. (in: a-proteobacteria)]HEV2509512.1 GntR family transcriptional regulator [Bosea sp. (in: a-proteobacteria)]
MTNEAGMSSDAQDTYPRITRRTLHEEVLERLRDMIIEGRLGPGQRINEGAVGAQLGVSRTPLREAIKTLASEGLVEIQPAKGAIVRKFSAGDLLQILEVLKTLEQLGGRMTCAQASDETIAAIKALHDEMMELYRTRNRLDYFKLNQAIHSAIVAASGNDVLVEMHGTLQARIKRLRFIGNEGPEKWAGAVAEHEEMIVALLKRDGEALAAVIGKHMDSTLVRVRDVL